MKIVGCDLHAKQQSIAMVDTDKARFARAGQRGTGAGVKQNTE